MVQMQEEMHIADLISRARSKDSGIDCYGPEGSSVAYLVSRLWGAIRQPVLVVVPSLSDAEAMLTDLGFFTGHQGISIDYFPAYTASSLKPLGGSDDIGAKRIGILYRLVSGNLPQVLVTTVSALSQKAIPKHVLSNYAELLIAGEETDRDLLIEKLIAGGYTRSAMVEEPGDFSIRGGILDLYTPTYADPLRMEFFGDVVDSIRSFSAFSQRRTGDLAEAIVLPAKESILEKRDLAAFTGRIRKEASIQDIPIRTVRELVDRIKREGLFSGLEYMLPLVYPQPGLLTDYLPKQTLFLLIEPARMAAGFRDFWKQSVQSYESAASEQRFSLHPASYCLPWEALEGIIAERQPISIGALSHSDGNRYPIAENQPIRLSIQDHSDLRLKIAHQSGSDAPILPLINWLQDRVRQRYTVLCTCSTRSQAERLASLLSPYGIQLTPIREFDPSALEKGKTYLAVSRLSSGFSWPSESLAVITEDDIFGSKHHRRPVTRSQIQRRAFDFEELRKGDYVVHLDHGIGKYDGLVKLRLDGATNDFLQIVYRDRDKLYLPVDRLGMLQKYVGVDGIPPHVDKLGGLSWDRVKERVKKSTEKIAGSLLRLYAARRVEKGHAFSNPDSYFQQFETGFDFEETPDQLKAIDEVLQDMAQPTPMDRLICGDVGYGKTEVALRAAFLAVNDGKQVSVLVPTTVLAEQHYATFSHRFKHYPVTVERLSRFRSAAKQRDIVKDLASGALDIVIGTHRLLQKDVAFRDLGLVILDEEQRFGVKDKERLKQLRKTVDVLALTATPIPRTLHMSLLGVRDISTISTPPEHRQAIVTYLSEFSETVIREAIENELNRRGQVFFVHNNINTIRSLAERVQALVPSAKLGIAHGRLREEELETVMLEFVNRAIDVLVCTTIIESGLDIPAANTIIVNRADRFGLAQMYQLRGRVGRAEEQAYAYLFVPKDSKMGKDAQKRLRVLMEYSDLGSGFQIAMSDLKIRGGGTILGDEQSGHIAAVGYDMFLGLMAESVAELKGEPIREPLDPEIHIPLSAYIPQSYVSDIDQRMRIYRRLSKLTSMNDILDLKGELLDRFGPLPGEATNLLAKMMLKLLCIQAGVKRLDLAADSLLCTFSDIHLRNPFGLTDLVAKNGSVYEFTDNHVFSAKLPSASQTEALTKAKNILKEIAQRVNS